MPYALRLAIESLWKEKWINLLSVLAIATGLVLISISLVFVHNIRTATGKLPERFSMTVFLKDGLQSEKIDGILQKIKKNPKVKGVKYISKEDALKELKGVMKDSDYILEGLEENPLPASIEISLKKEAVTESMVKEISKEFASIEGISDVSYGERFVSAIQAIKTGAEGIAVSLSTALILAVIFVCYSTVKILFYRRKEEIETLQLLGATRAFIKTPFVLEGGIIGLFSGLCCLFLVLAIRYLFIPEFSAHIPMIGAISFPKEIYLIPVLGLFVGITGAFIAIGRLRF